MIDPSKMFCPITREQCRKDCAWCVEMDVFTEEYVAKQYYCSVNLLATHLDNMWMELAEATKESE